MAGISMAGLVKILGTILTLVFLEGLLSADNALVLAVMVRHLPKDQQKRALRYGIFGAFFFRFIAIIFASTLLEYWWFKVVGGLYLLYLAITHLCIGDHDQDSGQKRARAGKGFWGTVIGVELADIAFSIDSILAAVAMADGLPREISTIHFFNIPFAEVEVTMKLLVIYLGGVLGILAMRFVAGYFLILLEKFAGLALGAYYLVAWIGLKLVGSGLHHSIHPGHGRPSPAWTQQLPSWIVNLPLEMPEWLFWTGMALIILASLVLGPRTKPETEPRNDDDPSAILGESEISQEVEDAAKLTAQTLLGDEEPSTH